MTPECCRHCRARIFSDPKFPLLSRGEQIISARAAVNQTDDEIPHDRTPLFDGVLITDVCFRPLSPAEKMTSSALEKGFVTLEWTKQLHGTVSSPNPGSTRLREPD